MLAGKYEVTLQEQTLTSTDEMGVEATAKEIIYNIDLAGKGSIVVTNYRSMLSVRVESYLEDTYGMLGHRTKDGLVGRDGETVVVEDTMGAEWQVRDDEPMLFHEVGRVQYPESCILPSVTSRNRRLRKAGVTLEAAGKACENVADDMKSFCIEDVIRSSDISMAHTYTASAW